MTYTLSSSNSPTVTVTGDFGWKPVGRGRRFDRLKRGLARRLRIPWVRSTLWEMENPQAGHSSSSYGAMWTSSNALANYSFACTCHPNERYSRKRKHRKNR